MENDFEKDNARFPKNHSFEDFHEITFRNWQIFTEDEVLIKIF